MNVLDTAAFPPGVEEKLKQHGTKFDAEITDMTRALYAPSVREQPTTGVQVREDVAYGDDPRQTLDVYRMKAQGAPTIIYVPGGGYQHGDKKLDGDFHRNLGIYFARHGFVCVVMNYRLAPQHPWPAGAEDVAAVVAWSRAEAERTNGDASRTFLMGQSAGATHVASYLFDPRFHPQSGVGVTAAVLLSGGGFRVGPNPPANRRLYFGEDESLWEDRSPLTHVNKSKVPLFLSVTEFDPAYVAAPTFDLAQAVTIRDKKAPQFAYWRGHNHVSTVLSIGSSQDDVGGRVREFLAGFS